MVHLAPELQRKDDYLLPLSSLAFDCPHGFISKSTGPHLYKEAPPLCQETNATIYYLPVGFGKNKRGEASRQRVESNFRYAVGNCKKLWSRRPSGNCPSALSSSHLQQNKWSRSSYPLLHVPLRPSWKAYKSFEVKFRTLLNSKIKALRNMSMPSPPPNHLCDIMSFLK